MIRFLFTTTVLIMLMSLSALPGSTLAVQSDSLAVLQALSCPYSDNPITHKAITLTSGTYTELLPDGNRRLTISIDTISNIDTISGCNTPCVAAILSADSGNGTVHYYLAALSKQKDHCTPLSYLYVGQDIKLQYFIIDHGSIEIWWLYSLPFEDHKAPHHVICRSFSLENNTLVDIDFRNSQIRKHAIECDTIFTDSVKTGAWVVKWNRTRAKAYNSETSVEKEIYSEVFADIDDIDHIIPVRPKAGIDPRTTNVLAKGDTIVILGERDSKKREKKEVSPYWQYWKKYEMLSIVGPYISYARAIAQDETTQPNFVVQVEQLDGDIDSSGNFTGIGSSTVPLDWVGSPEPTITGIFGKEFLYTELLHIPQIRAIYKDTLPENFDRICWDEKADKIINIYHFDRYFYFSKFIGKDSIAIRFGRSSVPDRMISEVILPIPRKFEPVFAEARTQKSSTEFINPDFLKNRKPQCLVTWETGNDTIFNKRQLSRRKLKLYEEFLKDGRFQEKTFQIGNAIKAYTKALEIFPNDITALSYRALSEFGCDKDATIRDCGKILSLAPNSIQALFLRGRTYSEQNQPQKALTDLNRAVNLDSTYATENLLCVRGITFMKLENYELAKSDFDSEIKMHPANFNGYCERALLYKKLGKYRPAIADFLKCLSIKPAQVNALEWLGSCYFEVKEYGKAIEYFNECYRRSGANFEVPLRLAASYYCKHNLDSALFHLENAIAVFSGLSNGMQQLSILESQGYHYTTAEKKAFTGLFKLRQNNKDKLKTNKSSK